MHVNRTAIAFVTLLISSTPALPDGTLDIVIYGATGTTTLLSEYPSVASAAGHVAVHGPSGVMLTIGVLGYGIDVEVPGGHGCG